METNLIPVYIESKNGHDTLEVAQAKLPEIVAGQLQQDKYATIEHSDGSTEILTAKDLPTEIVKDARAEQLNKEAKEAAKTEAKPTDEEAEIAALLSDEVAKEKEATPFQKKLEDAKSVQVTNKAKGG